MRLTEAELWELRTLAERVANAELRLMVAQAAKQETVHRLVAAHGLDPALPYTINHDDGTITQPAPRQE